MKWIRGIEGKFGRTGPSLGDLNGDGYLDVVVTMSFNTPDAKLYVLSGPTGEVLSESPIVMWAYASNSVVDLERDGSPEIVCCGRGRRVHVFNADGTLRWKELMETGGFYREAAVADLDGDGHYEIVDGSRYGPGFEVLSDTGKHLGTFGEDVCHVTPLAGDIDNDGKLELIIARVNTGKLTCYDLDAPAGKDSVQWPCYRGDSANTGLGCYPKPASKPFRRSVSVEELKAELRGGSVWGVNEAWIDLPAALPERALLEVAVTPERGAARVDVITLPMDAADRAFPYTIEYDGRQTVTFTLLDGIDGQCTALASFELDAPARESLEAWMEPRLETIDEVSKKLLTSAPGTAMQLSQMKAAREVGLEAVRRLAESAEARSDGGHDVLMRCVTELREELERDALTAHVLGQADAKAGIPPVLFWEDPNPWDEEPLWRSLERVQPETGVTLPVWMYRNEYEDCALNLLNVTSKTLTMQVRMDAETAERLDVREVIETPRRDGSWVMDALPELNAAHTITLPPGEARQLWFACNSKGLAAGVHTFPVELLAIGHGNWTQTVTIRMEVADIDLAEAPPFMRCNWSSPSTIRGKGFSDELTKSAVEAGMNVICMLTLPSRKCDETGNLIGEADWTVTDHELSLLTPECFMLLSLHVGTPQGVKVGDDVWNKGFRAWADEVTEHLAAKGFPTSQWAIYPVDEPGLLDGPRLKQFKDSAIPVRKAAPDVPIYANPAGQITEDNFRDLLPYVDVWCPELGTMLRRPWMVDFFQKDEGARFWSYEAPSQVKHLRPLGYYRSQSLIAFSLGMEGAGYWVHFYDDLWMNPEVEEYGVIYASGGAWVESRRWLATRDGAEDARAYRLLRKLAGEAREKGVAGNVCDMADALLNEELVSVLQPAIAADDVTRNVVGNYDPDYKRIKELRVQAGKLTVALRKALGK